jgi:osmotically inducible protein OsmC
MPARKAEAIWEGGLMDGKGRMKLGSGAFEEAKGTNPEELIGAAHAGCFSMALSAGLGKAGYKPKSIRTTAAVYLEKVGEGFGITKIELRTEAIVPGIDAAAFKDNAEKAKLGCPVSKALAGCEISLEAKLVQG